MLDRSRELKAIADLDVLAHHFYEQLQGFGARGFVASFYPGQRATPRHSYIHGTLASWMRVFDEQTLACDCPMTAHLQSNELPTTIDAVAESVARGSRAAEVMEIAAAMGIAHGVLVPLVKRSGEKAAIGIVTETRIHDPSDFLEINMLAMVFQGRFDEIARAPSEGTVRLTPREREVLRWFADGKSAEDVATILGITTSTVMFHYRMVAQQMGTNNRAHTVAESIRRGLLPG